MCSHTFTTLYCTFRRCVFVCNGVGAVVTHILWPLTTPPPPAPATHSSKASCPRPGGCAPGNRASSSRGQCQTSTCVSENAWRHPAQCAPSPQHAHFTPRGCRQVCKVV